MKQLFAYIRVSDPKQKTGVSLVEQRAIIERYATHIDATIVEWFEETRTAAKAGRPVFTRMLSLLRQGRAQGVVIHKLDRGTRNFRDWAEIDELIERGIEVYIANDNLDLRSRGGRLAADVQIAVAVDYIRNLREEALKGIHGRLKQGILPNGAGIGYRDAGAGKAKTIDPLKGPLVRRLFELYATGTCTLRDLATEADHIGLRNRGGRPLTKQDIQKVLRNPFYAGMIRSVRFGLFPGAHEPLVSHAVFDRVQGLLDSKFIRRTKRHDYLFRRLLKCATCHRSLIGSVAKGHVYYRCSNTECPTTSMREDRIAAQLRFVLQMITLHAEEETLLDDELASLTANDATLRVTRRAALTETLAAVNARLARLTDLLLEDKIPPEEHSEKRNELLYERHQIEQDLAAVSASDADLAATARRIVELAKSPETLYETADSVQKRQLIEILMSNCVASGKTVDFSLREPFATFANRHSRLTCGQLYATDRTFSREEIAAWGQDWPETAVFALHNSGFTEKIQLAA